MKRISKALLRLHSDESGQVLWIFIICALALVVLSGLVFNTGKQATRKIQMQNAVDAAALSGGMWYARGLNVVSMNNVAMTETLGLIANLRGMQQTAEINDKILIIEQAVSDVLKASIFPPTVVAGWVLQVGVWMGRIPTNLVQYASTAIDIAAKPTTGALWTLMKGLSTFSGVMTVAAPGVGFVQTINVGRQNIVDLQPSRNVSMVDVGSGIELPEGAILLPNLKTGGYVMPVERGAFRELCSPTEFGTVNNNSVVDRRGYTPFLGYAPNQGPHQKYKDFFSKIWWPSWVTGLPSWYGSIADLNLHVLCGGAGSTPSLPKVSARETDLQRARGTPGARDFTWNHSNAYTYRDGPNAIIVDQNAPAPMVDLSPNSLSRAEQDRLQREAETAAQEGRQPPTVDPNPGYSDRRVDPNRSNEQIETLSPGFQPLPADGWMSDGPGRWKKQVSNRIPIDYPEQPLQPIQGTYEVTTTSKLLRLSSGTVNTIASECNSLGAGGKLFLQYNDRVGNVPLAAPDQRRYSLEHNAAAYDQISCPFSRNTLPASGSVQNGQVASLALMKTVPKDLVIVHGERYAFLHATVDKSYDNELGPALERGSSSDYPEPYHFVVDGQRLTRPKLDPEALQTLQFVAIAHKQSDDNPWLNGINVTVQGNTRPMFQNPNQLGWFTYAQVQVYNPTSWDLYTQDWRVKLVPATSIDQVLDNGYLRLPILSSVSSFLKELNAH